MKCLRWHWPHLFPCKTLMYTVVKRCPGRERCSTGGLRSEDRKKMKGEKKNIYVRSRNKYMFFETQIVHVVQLPERAIKFHQKRKTPRGTRGGIDVTSRLPTCHVMLTCVCV